MPDLDIVIPLYKTEKNLSALIVRLNEWVDSVPLKVRVIFVDDGSPDDTFDALRQLLTDVRFQFLCLRLAVNYGQYSATVLGLSYSKAPLVATLDDDLQHDPFQLDRLLQTMHDEQADLVYGTYAIRKHSLFRTLGTTLMQKILFRKGWNYTGVTSFRLMKSGVVSVFKNIHTPVLFVDEYLMKYARKKTSCEVVHSARINGRSNYSTFKLVRVALDILLFYSAFPLKMITRFGLMMSLIFFVLGTFYIWQKTFNDVQLGFTSIIVSIFFSTGMILLSLGIIGEYIRRIWVSQHNLDRIIVAEEIG
jgi:glycosyltransferase involved in cell wall biosynthesis